MQERLGYRLHRRGWDTRTVQERLGYGLYRRGGDMDCTGEAGIRTAQERRGYGLYRRGWDTRLHRRGWDIDYTQYQEIGKIFCK
jgi:hypothetical protein